MSRYEVAYCDDFCEVTLKNGTKTKIDKEDLVLLDLFPSWQERKGYISLERYLETEYGPVLQRVYLHKAIVKPKQGWQIDHANRDKADNRRRNLRMATRTQNAANVVRGRRAKSGFRGVSQDVRKLKKQWRAYLGGSGTAKTIGRFETAEEAARAYDEAARAKYGPFAVLNFPEIA